MEASLRDKRLLTLKELMAYTGRGRDRARAWGEEIGACIKYSASGKGGKLFFDRLVVDREIDRLTRQNGGAS